MSSLVYGSTELLKQKKKRDDPIIFVIPNNFKLIDFSLKAVTVNYLMHDFNNVGLRTESTKSPVLPLHNKTIDAKLKYDCASVVTVIIYFLRVGPCFSCISLFSRWPHSA